MKILVDNPNEPVGKITFRLKSVSTNFAHILKPLDPQIGYVPHRDYNEVTVLLDDSYEIDSIIGMLEEFKRINHTWIGEWRYVR